MSDLAKNNDENGTNGGATDKIDTTGLSAAELYRRGRALAFGLDGVRIDGPRGLALLEAAAEAGSLDAQGELAEALADGLQGTQPDAARAVAVAKKPAQAGNPFALDALGGCFRNGLGGLPKDEAKARACFLRAFEGFKRMSEEPNPDVRALCYLGCYLGDGRGAADGKPNDSPEVAAETTRLWRRSAEIGFATAACNVAFSYFNGDGVERDETEGARWLRKAVELGYLRAIVELAFCYLEGNGVAQDPAEGMRWLRTAAEAGSAEAANHLGGAYEEGWVGEPNPDEAFRWFLRAAELGDAAATVNVAGILAERFGVEVDYDETTEESAADAARWLAGFYERGSEEIGFKRDVKRTVAWLRRSIELGDAEAASWLGRAYFDGAYGLQKNDAEAVRLYRLAAERGDGRGRAIWRSRIRSEWAGSSGTSRSIGG